MLPPLRAVNTHKCNFDKNIYMCQITYKNKRGATNVEMLNDRTSCFINDIPYKVTLNEVDVIHNVNDAIDCQKLCQVSLVP